MEEQRVALVTGANRGLGLETCRQLGRLGYKVILTARDAAAGEAAAAGLRDEGLDVQFRHLEVTDHSKIAALVEALKEHHGRLDTLVANSGPDASPQDTTDHLALCHAVLALMQTQGYGRIAILTGSLALPDESALAPLLEAEGENIKVNALRPSGVGVETALWLATLPDDGPTGGFFRDGHELVMGIS